MPKQYKKATRATDMCPICDAGKRAKKSLQKPAGKTAEQIAQLEKIVAAYETHRDEFKRRKRQFKEKVSYYVILTKINHLYKS